MNSLTMVEFPTSSAAQSARFLQAVFGWGATSYGPEYTDVDCGSGVSLGFQQDRSEAPAAPLAVIEVEDLDATRRAVIEAGGTVTVDAFDFPGGRRFHFREPGGNELAAWVPVSQG
ncbi:VOC family protein [Streptomyces chattanoogensis]|uniref:Bleomycin resistance protein n=1 Tax=Streptomyces chattanoogensis TaxID=66876 RepID=A0A0N0XZW0_9ACTN|nr:glyoxalase/bleomycin resistance/extradiol dioxygenase family protein [Streptomyces chattanoogensis]KPC65273.1 bleomycin resistance protein [Streptomyces chattanoogensis]